MCSHAPALGSPWDIAFGFHVSYATIHAKKYDVIAAINQVLAGNIMFPTTDAGLAHLAKGFAQISRGKGCCAECFAFTALHSHNVTGSTISNVVAAVDSVVIQRKCPVASKEKNIAGQYCRKGYFATTMLAFVDAFGRFLSISIVCSASSHDSTAFACSELGHQILTGSLGEKWSIVGDDAFTCSGNIITPFVRHGLNVRQRNYNYFCSLLRQVVECAFGRWKQKWGILWRPLQVDAANIKLVLECTCRLHNFCIDQRCVDECFVPPLEDLWWARTASPKVTAAGKAPLPPIAVIEPQFANARAIAAMLGQGTARRRNNREFAVQEVERSGLVAPDASGECVWCDDGYLRVRAGMWTRAADNKKRANANVGGLWDWRVE
jgi:hypothetical protein